MRFVREKSLSVFAVLAVVSLVFVLALPSFAQGDGDRRTAGADRAYEMFFSYPEIIIPEGSTSVDVELVFDNKGKRDETLYFSFPRVPEGWKVRVKTFAFDISALRLASEDQRLTTVTLEPAVDADPGVYRLDAASRTKDGTLKANDSLSITIQSKEEVEGTIELTSSYPVMQGSSDVTFEFALSVTNRTRQEQAFNLYAEAPQDWQVNFKPPFKDKYVSSVIMKPDESQSINVEVAPSRFAQAGEYAIPIRVVAGDFVAESSLQVIITGTYSIRLGTPTGLLSLETERGKPVTFSIFVRNTGSAPIRDISFLSVKPENWVVEFKPESINMLQPGSTNQVEMTIVPAEQALVGDYALGVSVNGEKSTDDMELRVTVKTSAAWGWIGIAIIMFVIIGLLALFMTLGRR